TFYTYDQQGRRLVVSPSPLESIFTVIHGQELIEFWALLNQQTQTALSFLKFHPTGPLTGRIPGLVKNRRLIFEVIFMGKERNSESGSTSSQASRLTTNFVNSLKL